MLATRTCIQIVPAMELCRVATLGSTSLYPAYAVVSIASICWHLECPYRTLRKRSNRPRFGSRPIGKSIARREIVKAIAMICNSMTGRHQSLPQQKHRPNICPKLLRLTRELCLPFQLKTGRTRMSVPGATRPMPTFSRATVADS